MLYWANRNLIPPCFAVLSLILFEKSTELADEESSNQTIIEARKKPAVTTFDYRVYKKKIFTDC